VKGVGRCSAGQVTTRLPRADRLEGRHKRARFDPYLLFGVADVHARPRRGDGRASARAKYFSPACTNSNQSGSCRLPLDRARARLPARSDCATSGPARIGRARTARPSASTARSSPAGPTAPSTATATNAVPHSRAGFTTTRAADHTPPQPPNPARLHALRNNLLGSYT
jgi:hypothetical protein